MYNYDPMPGWTDPDTQPDQDTPVCEFCGCYQCVCTDESMFKHFAYKALDELHRHDPSLANGYAEAFRQFDPTWDVIPPFPENHRSNYDWDLNEETTNPFCPCSVCLKEFGPEPF